MASSAQEVENAIRDPNFSHARQGEGCWRDLVWIYHRDEASPSGVKLAVGCDAAIVDPIIRKLRQASALSPAER